MKKTPKKQQPSLPVPASMRDKVVKKQPTPTNQASTAPTQTAEDGVENAVKIQLGAFRSTNDVKTQWQKIRARFPKELGAYSYMIQKADLGNKGVFYRLHVGPFSNKNQASALCKKLKTKNQGCFVVK